MAETNETFFLLRNKKSHRLGSGLIRLSRKHTRWLSKLQSANFERHSIFACRDGWETAGLDGAKLSSGILPAVEIDQIPDGTIEPGFRRLFHCADCAAACIGNRDNDLLLRLFFQVINKGQAIRLVGCYGEAVAIQSVISEGSFATPRAGFYGEEMSVSIEQCLTHLAQRCDVSDPDAAPVGASYQVAFARMHHQVMYCHEWHVAFQRRPLLSAIERDVNAAVVAYKQEVLVLTVFKDDIYRAHGQPDGDRLPGC